MIKDYNWSFTEMYMLPVALRTWYIDKACEMAKKMNEASNQSMVDKKPTAAAPAAAAASGLKDKGKEAAKKVLSATETAAMMAAAGVGGIGGAMEVKATLDTFTAALEKANPASKFFGESLKFTAEQSEILSKGLKEAASSTGDIFGLSLDNVRDKMHRLSLESMQWGKTISENNKLIVQFATSTSTKLIPGFDKTFGPLSKSISLFDGLNVATSDSIGIIDTLRGTLGQTAEQTILTRRELSTFAQATGQTVKAVAADYNKNISSFMDMLDPRRMNQAFMTFQAQAKRMNMEANTLYGIAQKFDTIDSANEIGGRLNQTFTALGIEFNALKLQDMSMEERTGYISQKVNEALKKARRDFTNQEARLLTRSLAGSLGVDVKTIRGLGAEGAPGGRLTAFEKEARAGKGMTLMSEQAEKDLARQITLLQKQQAAALEFAKQQAAMAAKEILAKTKEFKALSEVIDPRKMFVEFAELPARFFTPERMKTMGENVGVSVAKALDDWGKKDATKEMYNKLMATANAVGAEEWARVIKAKYDAGELTIAATVVGGFLGTAGLQTPVSDLGLSLRR